MNNTAFLQNQKGFTLIELAIAIIVVGIVLSMVISGLLLHKMRKDYHTTKKNLEFASHELLEFLKENQRLPCPAPKTADPQNFDGIESCDLMMKKGDIYYGLLPFKTLNMNDLNAQDRWNSLFHYAVSADLTDKDTFFEGKNKIIIYNENNKPKYSSDYRVPYIIYSTGENQANSYSRKGVYKMPCNEHTLEKENCDENEIFIDAPLSMGSQKKINGHYIYFDDILEYPSRLDDILEGELLFYFEVKCPVGFIQITEEFKPSHIQYVYQIPEFSSGDFILCQSINFNVSASFETDKHSSRCPNGWVHVGYTKSSYGEGQGNTSHNLCVK